MSLLQYKSTEMFSSTELIRKSKTIFNKIIDNEIDKAIIMRDGKPGFLLMDFVKYEEIMSEFEILKNKQITPVKEQTIKVKTSPITQEIIIEEKVQAEASIETKTTKYIEEKVISKPTSSAHTVPPRPKSELKEDIVFENEDDEKLIVADDEQIEILDVVVEKTEEEEIREALESIKSMNFDDNMKAMAEKKIKIKILAARKERAILKEQEEQDNKEDLKEELEIQVQIKEDNKKKERELKEFWD